MFYIRSLRTGWTSNVDQVKLIPPGKETATENFTLPSGGDNPMITLSQRTGWTATTPFNSITFGFRSRARYQPAIPAECSPAEPRRFDGAKPSRLFLGP